MRTVSWMYTLLMLAITIMHSSCGGRQHARKNELPFKSVSYYYGDAERDSLLVDLVTYIGRKPSQATAITRFEPQYRAYYTDLSKGFTLYYYSINGPVHTFYLSRPARSPQGNRRGVLGTFRRDENGKIVSFREVLNTTVGDEERIRQLGEKLMNAYLLNQHMDQLLSDRTITEWPDSTLYYDTILFEWRYVPYEIQ